MARLVALARLAPRNQRCCAGASTRIDTLRGVRCVAAGRMRSHPTVVNAVTDHLRTAGRQRRSHSKEKWPMVS
jgi:hypothetical protein